MHWLVLMASAIIVGGLLLILHRTSAGRIVKETIPDRPRRRLFLAAVSFFLTFATIRGMVYAITHQMPPFHYVFVGGRHIHHLVFGIFILLGVGYAWLAGVGDEDTERGVLLARLVTILYGVGAALTLDEFAMWLNLKDVYFTREGRSSFDAVVLFGSLLAISAWGAPLLQSIGKRHSGQAGLDKGTR